MVSFCVGAAVISENSQEYISIVTSMNDNDLDGKDGFASGNEFNFRFWNNENKRTFMQMLLLIIRIAQLFFQPLETYVGKPVNKRYRN